MVNGTKSACACYSGNEQASEMNHEQQMLIGKVISVPGVQACSHVNTAIAAYARVMWLPLQINPIRMQCKVLVFTYLTLFVHLS